MVVTTNKFFGAETQGGDELESFSGVSIETGSPRTGTAAVAAGSGNNFVITAFDLVDDAGDKQEIWFAFGTGGSFVDGLVVTAREGTTDVCWALEVEDAGGSVFKLKLIDAAGGTIGTGATTIATGVYHEVNIIWENLAEGDIDLYLNGSSTAEISSTAEDLTDGGSFDRFHFAPSFDALYDDILIKSGLSGVADRVFNTQDSPYVEVFGYSPAKVSQVPDHGMFGSSASTLDTGDWDDAGEVPFSDTAFAEYTSNSAVQGTVDLPAFGAEIDGDDQIKAMKYTARAVRGTGSTPTFTFGYGDQDDGDTVAHTFTAVLTASFDIYEDLVVTDLPTKTQGILAGFAKSANNMDMRIGDFMITVLHQPGDVGQEIAVGLATETDVAFLIRPVRLVPVGLASETDAAFVVRPVRLVPAGLAAETDAAFGIVPDRAHILALATETDIAQVVRPVRLKPVGLSSETDAAFQIDIDLRRLLGLAQTTETAFAVVPDRAHALGLASETDIGQTVIPDRAVAVGLAQTTATAFALGIDRAVALGLAQETDTAFLIQIQTALGIALETDVAFSITPVRSRDIAIGLAEETDTAFTITIDRALVLALAAETDTAFGVVPQRLEPVGLASETDAAFSLTIGRGVNVGLASEADIAFVVTADRAIAMGLAVETDTGFAVVPKRAHELGLAATTSTAFAIDHTRQVAIGLASETDVAFTLVGQQADVGSSWLLFRRRRRL